MKSIKSVRLRMIITLTWLIVNTNYSLLSCIFCIRYPNLVRKAKITDLRAKLQPLYKKKGQLARVYVEGKIVEVEDKMNRKWIKVYEDAHISAYNERKKDIMFKK